jgi:hypothetical protein
MKWEVSLFTDTGPSLDGVSRTNHVHSCLRKSPERGISLIRIVDDSRDNDG